MRAIRKDLFPITDYRVYANDVRGALHLVCEKSESRTAVRIEAGLETSRNDFS